MSLRMWPPNSKGSGPKIQREPSRCSSRLRLPLALRNCPGRVDEPDMAERLREVTKKLPADWIDATFESSSLVTVRPRKTTTRGVNQPNRNEWDRPYSSWTRGGSRAAFTSTHRPAIDQNGVRRRSLM